MTAEHRLMEHVKQPWEICSVAYNNTGRQGSRELKHVTKSLVSCCVTEQHE
jgi:hypothetical protein